MKLQNVPFTITDWNHVAPVEHRGASGTSIWQTFETGNIRVRVVEFSAGFKSDHYCERGHVVLVLEGELWIELQDRTVYTLQPGMSFQVEDDPINPHLVYTFKGAKAFIVD